MTQADSEGPKAYYLIEIAIHDLERYKNYPVGVEPLIKRFGGRYLVRGGKPCRSKAMLRQDGSSSSNFPA